MNQCSLADKVARNLAITLLVVPTVLCSVACSGELDPSDMDDAFELFHRALLDGDPETAWERSDQLTHLYFQERYESLQEMNDLIERYLPSTDHQIARRQSGVELLDQINSGKDLFSLLFQAIDVDNSAAIARGAAIQERRVFGHDDADDSGHVVVVVTTSDQEFTLVRQDDQLWYINLAASGHYLEDAFRWLTNNEQALQQTVQDLIEEEQRNREEIISQLMDVDGA